MSRRSVSSACGMIILVLQPQSTVHASVRFVEAHLLAAVAHTILLRTLPLRMGCAWFLEQLHRYEQLRRAQCAEDENRFSLGQDALDRAHQTRDQKKECGREHDNSTQEQRIAGRL